MPGKNGEPDPIPEEKEEEIPEEIEEGDPEEIPEEIEAGPDEEEAEPEAKDEGVVIGRKTVQWASDLPDSDIYKPDTIGEDGQPVKDVWYYRRQLSKNVKAIRDVNTEHPEFNLGDQEIIDFVTPEKVELYQSAHAVVQKYDDLAAQYIPPGHSNAWIGRALKFMLDTAGTPEADEKNRELCEKIYQRGPEGDRVRKETFCAYFNMIQELSTDVLDPKKSPEETMRFAVDHYALVQMCWESQNVLDSFSRDTGLTFSEEEMENLRAISDKAVSVGSFLNAQCHLVASEAFLTTPWDKVDEKNAAYLTEQYSKKEMPEVAGHILTGMTHHVSTDPEKRKGVTFTEPEHKQYTPDDISDARMDLDKTREVYGKLLSDMEKTEHWYQRNSTQYESLKESLFGLMDELNSIEEGVRIDDDKRQALESGIALVAKNAGSYIRAKEGQPVNANRQGRLDAANEIVRLSQTVSSATAANYIANTRNDAILAKEEAEMEASAKAYYDEVRAKSGYGRTDEEIQAMAYGDRSIAAKEQTFGRGMERTEALRKEASELPEGSAKRQILDMMTEAREKLSGMVGKTEINQEEARTAMATVVACSITANATMKEWSFEMVQKAAKQLAGSPAFMMSAKKITSDSINSFLTGPGEHKLTAEYVKMRADAKKAAQVFKKGMDDIDAKYQKKGEPKEKTEEAPEAKQPEGMGLGG